ncbi:MAG: hypothetical protein JXA18_10145 [Chitinispirillaceae bacterium]|nr:hypothetical protein [Chitinispirillaceae bacterium]
MKRSIIGTALITLLLATIVSGQMQLGRIYSRAVREGYGLQTHVDSLLVDTRVNSGLAVSRYTLVLTPGTYNYATIAKDTLSEIAPMSFDSIEMTMSFQLPSDFVADSMWLWIDGEPVEAQIQDRALASQQYREIVGVRRDPALLETWGRGSYNLRIFPASSLKSRKIAVEFHHTFNDDSTSEGDRLITACLPVTFDSTYVYYYNVRTSVFEKNIGYMEATFSAEDNGEYTVDVPGLGSGRFSSGKELTLSADEIVKLDPGMIVAEDPSGTDEFLWVGRDGKSEEMIAGVSMEVSDATMRFDDEPDTRIIIMDMRNSVWDWNEYYRKRAEAYNTTYTAYAGYEKYNIWERAQKYAVLALQQYLTTEQKFNVLIGGTTVQPVFDAPVEANAANLNQAIKAIVDAAPSSDASTEALIEATIAQAPRGIAVLISDLIQPPDYRIRVDNTYSVSENGAAYDSLMKRIADRVKKSDLTLFTIEDNYQLLRIALESGGYRLSGLLNRYNIAYSYKIVDGKRITVLKLPDLFGSSNYSGIRNLSVTSDLLADIAYSVDGYYNGYYYYYDLRSGGDVTITESDVVIERSLAKLALPSTYNSNNVLVRIAGSISVENSGEPVDVTIRGKTGGLWFTCEATAAGGYTPATSSYRPFIDPQWAFRRSEQLGFDNYIDNAAAIKEIGMEYHIVTRQTSLLALEPGMKLWVDSAWQQEQQSVERSEGGVAGEAMDASYNATAKDGGAPTTEVGSGIALDGVSLTDILAGSDIAPVVEKQAEHRSFSVTAAGSMIRITLPSTHVSDPIVLRLFDLKGRLVAQKSVAAHEAGAGTLQWNIARDAPGLSRGLYTMHISNRSLKTIFRITLMGS